MTRNENCANFAGSRIGAEVRRVVGDLLVGETNSGRAWVVSGKVGLPPADSGSRTGGSVAVRGADSTGMREGRRGKAPDRRHLLNRCDAVRFPDRFQNEVSNTQAARTRVFGGGLPPERTCDPDSGRNRLDWASGRNCTCGAKLYRPALSNCLADDSGRRRKYPSIVRGAHVDARKKMPPSQT